MHPTRTKKEKNITLWVTIEQWVHSHKLSKMLWKMLKTNGNVFFKYVHTFWQFLSHKNRHIKQTNQFCRHHYRKHETIISFLKALVTHPRTTGAILPSSKYLAGEMASHVIQKDQLVVELGAGTGVVTDMLLQSGISADKLIVIEYSHDFVKKLRARFPHVRVIEGNAINLCHLLEHAKVATIVSSIPLLALPRSQTKAILKQIETALQDKGRYIQFTYGLFQKSQSFLRVGHKIYSKCVWRNIPPARVDVWEK